MLNLGRFFTIVAIASAILMVTSVLQLTLYMKLDYQRQGLEKKFKELLSLNQHLELEVNQAGDLDKVSESALKQYNMVFPRQIIYLYAKN